MIYQDSNEELERELWEAVLAALSSVRKIPIVFSTTACRKRRILDPQQIRAEAHLA